MFDPRIRVLLKRYPKNQDRWDASLDVTQIGEEALVKVCRHSGSPFLSRPCALSPRVRAELEEEFGLPLSDDSFDYYLHAYVRDEFVATFYKGPTNGICPPPEIGPPGKIPLDEGLEWQSVRPNSKGEEQYIAVPIAPNASPEPVGD